LLLLLIFTENLITGIQEIRKYNNTIEYRRHSCQHFLMNITQRELAEAIHAPHQRVNELVNQKRGITPSTAAHFFGVSADFWLNLQIRWDLYKA